MNPKKLRVDPPSLKLQPSHELRLDETARPATAGSSLANK
jgi:hypothetical protein